MKTLFAASLFAFALAPAAALAQSPAATAAPDGIRDVAPVVVQGVQPGPGLWKVAKGDHVMWILGTQTPLPKRMQWRSQEVESALAVSQEVLYAPRISLTFEAGGFFRSLLLAPKVYGARKNPDGKTLRDVLPADLYARWVPLRQQYLGRGRGVERMRPLFAADALWAEALDDNDLVGGGIIGPVVSRAVKAHGLRETSPLRAIKVTDAKALLAEAADMPLDDIACLARTVERLEAGSDRLRRRANAWATGDLAALRAMGDLSQERECTEAAIDSPLLRKRGTEGVRESLQQEWLAAAEKALANNRSTFAMLPIDSLLADENYLAPLRARGYEVTPPE